jgi:hypothetical protein
MAINARIIFYILMFSFVGVGLFTLLTQNATVSNVSGEPQGTAPVGGWYFTLDFLCNLLISMVSIYCFLVYKYKFPMLVNVTYVVMVVLVFIASINDLPMFLKEPSALYSPKGLGTWINFGLLYFVAEEDYATKVFRLFKNLCYVLVAFNLMRLAMLGTVSNRSQTLAAFGQTTIILIWVYPFFLFDNSDKTSVAKIVKYGMIALIAFFSFAIAARSYMLIVIIILLIKLKKDLKDGKNAMLIVVMTGMCLMIGYFLAVSAHDFSSMKGLLNIFAGRMDDDTRSSQLKQFLDQFNMDKIFSGVGPSGTWNWSTQHEPHYEWLDNQFLLSTWWFGIQTCIVYTIFIVYPLFRKNTFNNQVITSAKIMIFFWILACGGLAIYVTFSTKLYYYFITMLIGVATLNVRELTILSVSKPIRKLPTTI